MKKNILLCIAMLALGLAACDKEKVAVSFSYNYGITGYNSDAKDSLECIQNYLEKKGCFIGTKSFRGKNLSEMDETVKNDFQKEIEKISIEEIKQLGLKKEASFTYSASRPVDPTSTSSNIVILKKFSYTEK